MKDGRRLALIVASKKYEDSQLRQLVTTGRDAETLARVLGDKAIGAFEITRYIDARHDVLRKEIERFFATAERNDLLLFYFAGHGIKDDQGDLYLAVRDTEYDLRESTSIAAEWVSRPLGKSMARCKVVVLDCCYSGAFAEGTRADNKVDLGRLAEGSGTYILASSDKIEYAREGNRITGQGTESSFTQYLVEGLKTGEADQNQDGWVSLEEWFEYARQRVLPKQHAKKWVFEGAGTVVIAKSPEGDARLISKIENGLGNYNQHPERVSAVSTLGVFLRSGEPTLKHLAHDKLTHLANSDHDSIIRMLAKQYLQEDSPVLSGETQARSISVDSDTLPPSPEAEPIVISSPPVQPAPPLTVKITALMEQLESSDPGATDPRCQITVYNDSNVDLHDVAIYTQDNHCLISSSELPRDRPLVFSAEGIRFAVEEPTFSLSAIDDQGRRCVSNFICRLSPRDTAGENRQEVSKTFGNLGLSSSRKKNRVHPL